ncbi:MAG TPA: hypothetical protein PLO37_02925 [Candidatus Hydrogenedentes bacterium]|nr:hypothetical protein [Candidatus Hydrogenedentota bacterium]
MKRLVVRMVLLALGTAFEQVSKRVRELGDEIARWEDGRTFAVGVLPDGPTIALRKEGSRIRYLGEGDHGAPLRILFKNLEAALPLLLGRAGSHVAFARHSAVVQGNVAEAAEANRAMVIVQQYLFPEFILRKILKRRPTPTGRQRWIKIQILAGLFPAMALTYKR